MGKTPNVEAAARDPISLRDEYQRYGMAVPDRLNAAAEALIASRKPAEPSAEKQPIAPEIVPEQKAPSAQRGPDGKFLKRDEPKAETPAAASPAAPAKADPTPAPKAPEKIKVRLSPEEEAELLPEEIAAAVLLQRGRPVYEEKLAENLKLQKQRKDWLEQKEAEVRAQAAEIERRAQETAAYEEYLLDAEKKLQAGEVPSIADFLSQRKKTHAATPAAKVLTEEGFDALYRQRRAAEEQQAAEATRRARAERIGSDFDLWVTEAVRSSPILSKRTRTGLGPDGKPTTYNFYAENVGFQVADSYWREGINLADLPDKAIKDRISAKVKEIEADEQRYITSSAGEFFDAHKGKALPIAPNGNTGTPTPQAPDEFKWDQKAMAEKWKKTGYNLDKLFEGRAREQSKFREEVARFRGR